MSLHIISIKYFAIFSSYSLNVWTQITIDRNHTKRIFWNDKKTTVISRSNIAYTDPIAELNQIIFSSGDGGI